MLISNLRNIFVIILFPLSALAKDNKLYPGYYLNDKGDTVKCSIEFGDWNKNPSLVRVTGPDGPLYLSPEETKGFGVYGYADYAAANVTYHPAVTSGTILPYNFSDSLETKRCFLKILSIGTFRLYELETGQRTVFFIGDHNQNPTELIYRVALRDYAIVEDGNFREELRSLFTREGKGGQYDMRISHSAYQSDDILALVNMLNGAAGGIRKQVKTKNAFHIFASAGIQLFMFPTAFNGDYSVNNHFRPALSPLLGVGFLYKLSPVSGRFRLGMSASYGAFHTRQSTSGISAFYDSQNFYDTTRYSEHTVSSDAFVSVHLFLVGVINPQQKVQFYLVGGISYAYSLEGNATVYTQYTGVENGAVNGVSGPPGYVSGQNAVISISRTLGNFVTGIGVGFANSQLEMSWSLPSKLGHFDGSATQFKIGALSLSYGWRFQ